MSNLATWFTPSLQTISRSAGRSSVLAAAYRACIELTDERLGITRDFTPKGKHGLAENICIGIPNNDIGKLFNDGEKAETRANSTVARELMVPLPSAWTDAERAQCARGMGEMLRARYGVAVLVSIHRPSKDNKNDHVHILFTTREVDANGKFGKKTRILDDAKTGEVKKLREAVCEIVNVQAKAQGDDWYVYAGKFSDVIEDYIPTKHISIKAGKSQKARIDANRSEVAEARKAVAKTKADIAAIDVKIEALQKQPILIEPPKKLVFPKLVPTNYVKNKKPIAEIDLLQKLNPDLLQEEKPAIPEKRKKEQIPEAAIKARKEIDKYYLDIKIYEQNKQTWRDMKSELLKQRPKLELNYFGYQTSKSKKALTEHNKSLQEAEVGMKFCDEKINAITSLINKPERQQLNSIYDETIRFNESVDAYNADIDAKTKKQAEELEAQQSNNDNQEPWAAALGMSDEEAANVAQTVAKVQNGELVSVDSTQDATTATGSSLGSNNTHEPDEEDDSYHTS